MRRTVRGRSRCWTTGGTSLFPFLAVLICTMGALILLLVVIARQARLQAAQAAQAQVATDEEDLETAREMVHWRISELKTSREKTEAQLAEARLQLGHLEDHERQLREELARLEAAWNELQKAGANQNDGRDALRQELARLRQALAEAERKVTEARARVENRKPSYAVVPYQGPHGTRRRPIYIECREDAIILQPEGIILMPNDFEGPMEPGNPLDAALRAKREYLLSRGRFHPESQEEPYPLLLVRPGGEVAYSVAREAMKSWGSEFGYELIGEDWELKFPSEEPGLGEVMAEAVDTARIRQRRLIAAAPRLYAQSKPRATYTVAPYRGGIVRYGGTEERDEPRFGSRRPGGGYSPRPGTSEPGEASSRGGHDGSGSSPSSSGADPAYAGLGAASKDSPAGLGSTTKDLIAGHPPSETLPKSTRSGNPMRPGEWMPGAKRDAAGGETTSSSDQACEVEPLAQVRGEDWGLRRAARGSIPLTRPIRIDCYSDRLVIVPEKGVPGGKVIPLGSRTEDSIDQLISAIWEHMDRWGIAGRGMYWRPILNVHAAPDAQKRAGDLKILLDGSGLEVRRK